MILGVFAGCAAPRGAILQSEILKESKKDDASYEVVSVTRESLARVAAWPMTGPGIGLSWPGKGQSQTARALRPGDTVNLTIWDSQANSLLGTPEQRAVPMRGLSVSPDGTIFVPYIEEVKVAGLSPEAARADIQARLTPIAPSAQVQLEVVQGNQNTIELVSGVQKPGRYPVAANGVTILSMLAEAGGIPDSMRNPVVRMQRGGKAYAVLARDLYRDPGRDILMRGGDRVAIESDPRSFVVLGATGAERTVHFEQTRHTLLEALSLSNGLSEARADLRAILVLRKYPAAALRADGSGPAKTQVVFTFDLSTGDGLFAASSFEIHPDDVILATESAIPSSASVLGIFGAALGTVQRVESF